MSPEQKIFDIFLSKYVNEEIIMRKDLLDSIHANNKEMIRWIVGTGITVGLGLAGLIIALLR